MEPKVLTAAEREIIMAELPSYLTKRPDCEHTGAKLKGHRLWACGLIQALAGDRMYVDCTRCTGLSIGNQEAARILFRRIVTQNTRTCCGGAPISLEDAAARLKTLDPAALERALEEAVKAGMSVEDALKLAGVTA